MIAAIAIIASLLADAFLFATLAELIAAGYTDDPHAASAWAFCLVALAGYGLPRILEGFEVSSRTALAITGLGGLLLIYTLVRITSAGDIAIWDLAWIRDFLRAAATTADRGGHAITAAVLLLATWGRSSLRAGDDIEMESIPRSFALPFAFVTAFVVVGAITDRSGEVGRSGAAFYAVAIISLACAQLALSGATFGEMRAGSTAGVMLLATGGAAVVVLLVIGLFTAVLGPIVGPVISSGTQWILTIVLTPFAWVLTKLFEFLFAGASPLQDLTEATRQTTQDAGQPKPEDHSAAGEAGLFMLRMFALLLFFAAAAAVVTVFVRLQKRRNAATVDGREVGIAGNLREDFGSMFRSLFRRPAHREAGYASTEATRLYLEVLGRAETTGHNRPAGETASEFAPELKQAFATPVTDDITQAFEAARYGGREPDARAIAELRRRWQEEAR